MTVSTPHLESTCLTLSSQKIKKNDMAAWVVYVPLIIDKDISDIYFNEFLALANAVDIDCLGVTKLTRMIDPDPKCFLGKGKIQSLAELIQVNQISLLLFNAHLTPSQERNLEQALQCQILDRVGIILAIFAKRARSFEGKLQVELAQLNHLATRLVRGWSHLERQKGGIGLRGPGETQLETDRRLIQKRVKRLKQQLDKTRKQRDQSRQRRQKAKLPTFALVGYTNAGKSTLFNELTKADIYAANKPFSTLDPTLRRLNLPKFGEVILADTVGFIHDLPPMLIDAFQATLQEVKEADVLIHVVDASHPERRLIRKDVQEVLIQLGVQDKPCLLVYNKLDQLRISEKTLTTIDYRSSDNKKPYRIWLSAQKKTGIQALKQAMLSYVSDHLVEKSIFIPFYQAEKRAKIYALNFVINEFQEKQGWRMHVRANLRFFETFKGL